MKKECPKCQKEMEQEFQDCVQEGYREKTWFWVCECGYYEEVSDEETLIY